MDGFRMAGFLEWLILAFEPECVPIRASCRKPEPDSTDFGQPARNGGGTFCVPTWGRTAVSAVLERGRLGCEANGLRTGPAHDQWHQEQARRPFYNTAGTAMLHVCANVRPRPPPPLTVRDISPPPRCGCERGVSHRYYANETGRFPCRCRGPRRSLYITVLSLANRGSAAREA